jgi:hypothetical protein
MAESAMASTSSFGRLSEISPQQQRPQKGSQYLANNSLGQKSQTKYSSLTPSGLQADITALESTLAQYQSILSTLKAKSPLDPDLKSSLDTSIRGVEAKISALQTLIDTAKRDLSAYLKAQEALSEAKTNYDNAVSNSRGVNDRVFTATTALTQATTELEQAKSLADASLTNLNVIKAKTDTARANLSSADASLTTQIEITNNALISLNNAKATTTQRATQLQQAQQEYQTSLTNLENATTAKLLAQQSKDTASTNLSNAISSEQSARASYNEAHANLLLAQDAYVIAKNIRDQKQTSYNNAHEATTQQITIYNQLIDAYTVVYDNYIAKQFAFQTAQSNLSTAEANLNQAQWNYDNNLIVDPNAQVAPTQPGLTVRVYNQLNSSNPQRSDTAYNLCKTTTLTKIENNWGGGDILGCGGDRVMIHYTGYLTPTENITYLMNMADDGFYMDLNGVNVINNWYLKGCGGNWNSVQLQAGKSYAIDAWFYEWGGGACSTLYYQSATNWGVVPAAWYSQNQPAPMIKDPAKLVLLQEAQGQYDSALAIYTTANSEWISAQAWQQSAAQDTTNAYYSLIALAEVENSAYAELQAFQGNYDLALSNKTDAESIEAYSQVALDLSVNNLGSAQLTFDEKGSELNKAISDYDLALSNKQNAEAAVASAEAELATAQQNQDSKDTDYVEAISQQGKATLSKAEAETNLANAIDAEEVSQQDFNNKTQAVATAQSTKDQATQALATEEANLQEALEGESVALATMSEAEDRLTTSKDVATQSYSLASNATDISFTDVEQILNTPIPVPEEGSKEIPVDLSAENLMEVDLDKVDPTELTEAQAEQLKEAALETFETAEKGSPEYEQALDALYLAAQQDDIELPAELAAIPGLAGAVEVLNFLGNAGADMSPQVREESKKVIVAAVVAAGVAVQAATGAATSAAVSASASTGSSGSGSRRTGK